jgi:hypothetical protein
VHRPGPVRRSRRELEPGVRDAAKIDVFRRVGRSFRDDSWRRIPGRSSARTSNSYRSRKHSCRRCPSTPSHSTRAPFRRCSERHRLQALLPLPVYRRSWELHRCSAEIRRRPYARRLPLGRRRPSRPPCSVLVRPWPLLPWSPFGHPNPSLHRWTARCLRRAAEFAPWYPRRCTRPGRRHPKPARCKACSCSS